MGELADSLALQPVGPGEWRGTADPRYEAGTGMFGGWTAAILLNAVVSDARAEGTPSAITVHYLKKIETKSELTIRARPLGGSRSIRFWNAEIVALGQDEVAASATILMTLRKPTDSHTEQSMPLTPDPETLPGLNPPAPFGERTLVKTDNPGIFDQPTTQSNVWVRELSGRPIDYVQLAYLADAYAPRIMMWSKGPRLCSTITMSIYFHALAEELAALGDDFILSEVTGTRAQHSTIGSQARLWSRKGALLATTEQLCWFK